MSKEILLRMTFFFAICVLYYLGIIITTYIKTNYHLLIDLKILMPIFGLVFMDFFFRRTNHLLVSLTNFEYRFNDNLALEYDFFYHGSSPICIEFVKLKGINGLHFDLIYEKSMANENGTVIPEDFTTSLSGTDKKLSLNFSYSLRENPKPIFIIPIIRWSVYYIRLQLSVNDKKTINSRRLIIRKRLNQEGDI